MLSSVGVTQLLTHIVETRLFTMNDPKSETWYETVKDEIPQATSLCNDK